VKTGGIGMISRRHGEPVERVPATPDSNTKTQSIVTEIDIHSYITFEPGELLLLKYFQIKIYGYPLAAFNTRGFEVKPNSAGPGGNKDHPH